MIHGQEIMDTYQYWRVVLSRLLDFKVSMVGGGKVWNTPLDYMGK